MPRALKLVTTAPPLPSEPLVLDRGTREALAALCADLVRLRGLESQPNPKTVSNALSVIPAMQERLEKVADGLRRANSVTDL